MSCSDAKVLEIEWLSGTATLGQIYAVGPDYYVTPCEFVYGEYSLAGCVSSASTHDNTTSACSQVIGEYALAGCVSAAPVTPAGNQHILGLYPMAGPP